MRAAALLALVLATATTAAAEPRTHDGVYLRFGVGAGYPIATFAPAQGAESDASGLGVSTELAAGITVRSRLVIGGGTFPMVSPSPSYDGMDPGGQHVSGTGPFVAYWLDARGGLQLQGGLLFAAGYLDGSDSRESHVGFGYGGMAGVGYDRFVSPTSGAWAHSRASPRIGSTASTTRFASRRRRCSSRSPTTEETDHVQARHHHRRRERRDPQKLAGLDGVTTRAADATDPETAHTLVAEQPDLVVVAAGVRPRMASIDLRSWDELSAAWNNDLKRV